MEGINMLGRLVLVKNGVLKPDKATALKEGENMIGTGAGCILRLKSQKSTTQSVLDVHCVIGVSKNGAALCKNKSEGVPIRINDKLALRPQFLKHGDTLSIIDMEFRYLNEHVKDKPEDFFAKEKLGLIPIRKSVNPLPKTPARITSTPTPHKNLNLSLRANETKLSRFPKLNQTLQKSVARTKTPNYRTPNKDTVQKKLIPKTPNLANISEQDLIAFSPLAQPLRMDHEDVGENMSDLPSEPQFNESDNEPSSMSLGLDVNISESSNKTTRQSKLEEPVNSDVGDEDVDFSRSEIFEESVEEQRNFVTVRPRRLVQEAKISEKSQTRSSASPVNKDSTVNSLKAFFTMDSSVCESDTGVMDHVDKTMTTLKESVSESESNHSLYDINYVDDVIYEAPNEDDIIPETQQANDDSVFLEQNDAIEGVGNKARTGTVLSDSFNSVYQDTKDEASVSLRSTRLLKSIRKTRSVTNEHIREAHSLSRSSKKKSSEHVSAVSSDSDTLQDKLTQDAGEMSESRDTTLDKSLTASESRDTIQNKSSKCVSTFDKSTQDATNISSKDTIQNKSKRVSTCVDSATESGEMPDSRKTTLNKSVTAQVMNISASESSDTIQNKSSKRASAFDESTQDPVIESVVESKVLVQKRSSRRISTFNYSTQDAAKISSSESKDAVQKKSSKRVSTYVESTIEPGNISESMETTPNKSLKPIAAQVVNISVSESRDSIPNKSSKCVSAFDESTQDPVNESVIESKDAIQKRSSKRFSCFNYSTQDAENTSSSESEDSIQNQSSKRVSTYVESITEAGNISELMETTSNKSLNPIKVENISASESRDTIPNKSSKYVSDLDESAQNAVNESVVESKETIQKRSSKHMSTFEDSTQDAENTSSSESEDAIQNKSSKRVSTYVESTTEAGNILEPMETTLNESSKPITTKIENISTSKSEDTSQNSTFDAANVPASESSKRISTFDESTQDAVNISTSGRKSKRMSTFDESTQVVEKSKHDTQDEESRVTTLNKSSKRISTFDESTQDAVNISTSGQKSKRMSTFDESTQVVEKSKHDTQDGESRATTLNKSSKRISTFDESTQDAVDISTSGRKSKRMSTFDESTQVIEKSKCDTQDAESTKEVLQDVSEMNPTDILDDTEFLSPVRPLKKSMRVQASVADISNNTELHGSTLSQTVKCQLSNSSMTETSLNPSSTSAKSVSSQSFSSFKHNKPETPKAGKLEETGILEETEIIDVLNFTDVGTVQSPDVAVDIDTTRASMSKSRASSLAKRRFSNRTSQMFVDVTCTSTPFQKQSSTRQSNKEVNNSSMSQNNTLRAKLTLKRRSSRVSVSKKAEHDCPSCKSITNQNQSLDTSKNVANRKSRSRSNSVTEPKTTPDTLKKLTPLEMSKNVSAKNKRSLSQFSASLFRTPTSQRKSRIDEKLAMADDETPKSHLTTSRRLSKSTYNPEVEDITPVTPERLCVSGFSDESKIPNKTPVLVDKVNVESQNTETITEDVETAESDLTSKKPQQVMRRQRSPLNRLSNFEGIKKLMKTPPNSPKNDLRNIPNLRRIMSPKQEKSPINDLTNPVGVKNLFKTPKQQKNPTGDLSDAESDVSGLAEVNVSNVEVLSRGSDIENSEDLFTQLTGQQPRKSYNRKCNSLSISKAEMDLNSRKTMGDLPNSSPRVQKWVEETSAVEMESLQDDDDVFADEPTPKSRSERSLSATKETSKSQNNDVDYSDVGENEQMSESDEFTDEANVKPIMDNASPKSEVSKSSYDAVFDDSTDEEVSLQKNSSNLEKSDVKDPSLQKSDESSLEYSDNELEAQNSDDQLSAKLEHSIDEGNISGSVPEKRDTMSERPFRKLKGSRSLSPSKVTPQQYKSRKSVFNFSITTAVPDVDAWKQERNEQINIEKPETPLNEIETETNLVTDNDSESEKLLNNMPEQPVRKSKKGRSFSPTKSSPQHIRGRKSEFNFSVSTAIPDVEIWKRERIEQKGTKRKSSPITQEVLPEKKRCKVTFDIPDEESLPEKKGTRSGRVIKKSSKVVDVKKQPRRKGKAAQAAKEVSEEVDNENNKAVDNQEEGESARAQTETKTNTRNRKKSTMDIDENPAEVSPLKKRGRNEKAVEASKPTKGEVENELEAVVDVPPPKRRRQNTKEATVASLESEENEIKISPLKPRTRRGKAITDADSASISSPKQKGRKVKNATEPIAAETDTASASTSTTRERRAKTLRDATAVTDSPSTSSPKPRGRNVEVIESNNTENPSATSKNAKEPPKKRGRKAEAVDEQETISVSPPKTRKRNAKVPVETPQPEENENKQTTTKPRSRAARKVAEETADIDTPKTNLEENNNKKARPKPRGRRAKDVAEEIANIETSTSSPSKPRGRRAKNVAEEAAVVNSSTSSTPKPNQEEIDDKRAPQKPRGRRAKDVAEETADVETSTSSPSKSRGRRVKNVTEEAAVVESSTSSTPKPNQEEIDNKRAPQKPRGRRAKDVAEEAADLRSSTSSPSKSRGRRAKNVAEEATVVDSSTSSTPKPTQEEIDNKQAVPKTRGGRRAKNIAEETADIEIPTPKSNQEEMDNKQTLAKPRGRRAKNIAEETAEVDNSKSSTPKQNEMNDKQALPKPRARRAKNVVEESTEVETSTTSTLKTNQEEVDNKPRGRRAKNVVKATADVETSTSFTPKPNQEETKPKLRGRKAKNVVEEIADFEKATTSTPNLDQEEMDTKKAKPKGRRAKNVAHETPDAESSTPKKRGGKAKNVTGSIDDIEPPSTKGRSTRAATKAQEDKTEVIPAAPPKKRTRR
ncbi:unnamed protein product [Ceutorhynchus assimilis]|uniref:FHA domain-containing protein n=1 Tax=Ceutorhynchus assimilis TaxID=467358 RepID=A0A9N9MWX8_9CUCU|nr:unnamed protein product [Ceutorhynchus assimilis]